MPNENSLILPLKTVQRNRGLHLLFTLEQIVFYIYYSSIPDLPILTNLEFNILVN